MVVKRARRWVAGPRIADAVHRARALNRLGLVALVNRLGEQYTSRREVARAMREHLSLMRALDRAGAHAGISVKLSAIGELVSPRLAERNAFRLAREARRLGLELWLDAERHELVPSLYRIYPRLHREFDGAVGVTVLASLKRSTRWARALPPGSRVRLARGPMPSPLGSPSRASARSPKTSCASSTCWPRRACAWRSPPTTSRWWKPPCAAPNARASWWSSNSSKALRSR